MIRRVARALSGTQALMVSGAAVICAVVLVIYYPSIRIGFYGDDWWLIANAGRLSLGEYLRYYFDPGVSPFWYRPLHGVLLLIEYPFFKSSPEGYHVVQILIHMLSGLVLYAIVREVSGRWQLSFATALLYAVFYPGSKAVFQITVHDPLANLFYLAAVLGWVLYVKTERRPYYWAAAVSFVLALMSKETSATLIVTLFLVDWLFLSRRIEVRLWLRRYALFALLLLIYLGIEYRVQLHAYFPNRGGYSVGPHVIDNVAGYLKLLVWPWDWEQTAAYVWAGLAVALLAGLVLRRPRSIPDGIKLLLFLVVEAVLAVAAVLGLPVRVFEPRYLYPASVAAAVLVAALFEAIWRGWAFRRVSVLSVSGGLALAVLLLGGSTYQAAAAQAEFSRELRVPFRDIAQQHADYPPDTYLFFINPPHILKHFGPSIFYFRYGPNVTVNTIDPEWWGSLEPNRPAALRQHKNTFIYYYDEANTRREIPVDPVAETQIAPALPVDFEEPLRLEGYEVTSAALRPGQDWGVLLYWRATGEIARDYTIFVHLVDEHGQTVAGEDGQPHRGLAPTHTWRPDKLVTDEHILSIPSALPARGRYHLEIGMYYLRTMERLAVLDEAGRVITDALVIEPFHTAE